RLRKRLAGVKQITVDSRAVASREYHLVVAPGAVIDDAIRHSATTFAHAHGIEVLDLVPGDLPALAAISLARWVDPAQYRTKCFARGHTTGYALLVHHDVLKRTGASNLTPRDALAFVRLAMQLKRYACTTTDLAIAPGLRATSENLDHRLAMLRE